MDLGDGVSGPFYLQTAVERKSMGDTRIIREPVSDMEAVYIIHESGQVSFSLIPADGREVYFEKIRPDPLIQISCTGDASTLGFAAGETRHNSAMTMSMKYVSQKISKSGQGKNIITNKQPIL